MQAAGLKKAFQNPNLNATLFAPNGALQSTGQAAAGLGQAPRQAVCLAPCLQRRMARLRASCWLVKPLSPGFDPSPSPSHPTEAAWQRFFNDCKAPKNVKEVDVAKYCSLNALKAANKAELKQVSRAG